MFITNGDEIINLEFVRTLDVFNGDKPMIRLNIDEHQFSILRFADEVDMEDVKAELITMLCNISEDWNRINPNLYVRTDKLRYTKAIGSELVLYMDTGCIKTVQKPIYQAMNTLADVTGAIYFDN